MTDSAGIVLRKPGIQIVGYSCVEMFPDDALKDVDVFHDVSACAICATRSLLSCRAEGLLNMAMVRLR